jgi:hypothetical protein
MNLFLPTRTKFGPLSSTCKSDRLALPLPQLPGKGSKYWPVLRRRKCQAAPRAQSFGKEN